jgi:hypothetical protein
VDVSVGDSGNETSDAVLLLLFFPRTWERFRCTADAAGTGPSCADDPDNCISDKLVRQHTDILAQPEWKSVGYEYINIDVG